MFNLHFSLDVHNVHFETVCVCMCVCVYIYMYVYPNGKSRLREIINLSRAKDLFSQSPAATEGKGVRKERFFMNLKKIFLTQCKDCGGLIFPELMKVILHGSVD